jgi:hypothetical protein
MLGWIASSKLERIRKDALLACLRRYHRIYLNGFTKTTKTPIRTAGVLADSKRVYNIGTVLGILLLVCFATIIRFLCDVSVQCLH